MTVRVAFLGTPDLAIPALDALTDVAEVALVVTQPDRPAGRSLTPVPPPVKQRAVELGIPVAQPDRSVEVAAALSAHGRFDAAVLVAYGMLIRPEALAVPARGFLNIHFSILPRWRGAAPVQRALMAGDSRVGVSVMVLDEGLDTGPVIATTSTAVGQMETAGSVGWRLATTGARLMTSVLEPFLAGRVVATPQPAGATTAPKITPGDRPIDWRWPTWRCLAHVRGLAPKPGATAVYSGEPHKILAAVPAGGTAIAGSIAADDGVYVGTGDGRIEILRIQPPGRAEMDAAAWYRGLRSAEPGFETSR